MRPAHVYCSYVCVLYLNLGGGVDKAAVRTRSPCLGLIGCADGEVVHDICTELGLCDTSQCTPRCGICTSQLVGRCMATPGTCASPGGTDDDVDGGGTANDRCVVVVRSRCLTPELRPCRVKFFCKRLVACVTRVVPLREGAADGSSFCLDGACGDPNTAGCCLSCY